MPSSPAEAALAGIAADYEAALRAVEADDLERLDELLDTVERRLAGIEAVTGEAARTLLAQAQARHLALSERVARARADLAQALEHVRAGRRALVGYAPGAKQSGTRFDRDI